MARKMGRPKSDNPKNIRLEIRITKNTASKLTKCADALNTSRVAVIEKGIDLVEADLKNKK